MDSDNAIAERWPSELVSVLVDEYETPNLQKFDILLWTWIGRRPTFDRITDDRRLISTDDRSKYMYIGR